MTAKLNLMIRVRNVITLNSFNHVSHLSDSRTVSGYFGCVSVN
jgi:hypothetical protein